MNIPKTSVLMSVYNGERYLHESVESILNQTFTDFEFIILDDGSTDDTWQILTAYARQDHRIVLVRNDKNIGLTRSLNKGLAMVRGEYIARQDADDISVPERLEKQVAYLEAHPSTGLVGSIYEFISGNGESLEVVEVPTENEVLQQHLLVYNCFCHGAVMFRRICLDIVGEYRTFFKTAQDYDLWLRIAERFEVANLPERLYLYRLAPECIGVRQIESQVGHISLIKELSQQRRDHGQEKIQLDENGLISLDSFPAPEPQELFRRYLTNARLLYLAGDEESASISFGKAMSIFPDAFPEEDKTDFFFDWLLEYAQFFSRQTHSYNAGDRFISTMLSGVKALNPQSRDLKRKTLGAFHVKAAFAHHAQAKLNRVRHHLIIALRNDTTWLLNKGILSMGLDTLLGSRLTSLRRRMVGGKRA